MDQKIKKVMSQVFDVDEDLIFDNTTYKTLTQWDSISHMKLIVALEETFNISFSDQDVLDMQSFKLIKYILSNK